MNRRSAPRLALAATVALILLSPAPAADLTGFPFADEELAYSINLPTGLGVGEAHMRARHNSGDWDFEFTVDAGIPGYQVKDLYHSIVSPALCTRFFQRTTSHGRRQTDEKETVAGAEVTRATPNGGGESHLVASDCVKDALGFLFFTRRELGQGRVPPAQSILLGGLHQLRLDYAGEQTVRVNGQPAVSDEILCTVTTASSDVKFEMYFARDAARTPLVVRVPFAVGTFSMELIR